MGGKYVGVLLNSGNTAIDPIIVLLVNFLLIFFLLIETQALVKMSLSQDFVSQHNSKSVSVKIQSHFLPLDCLNDIVTMRNSYV